MEFDIAAPPPRPEEIEKVREQLQNEKQALDRLNKQFLFGTIAALATLLTLFFSFGIPAVKNPGADPTLITTFVLYIPYVILFVYAFSNTVHHKKVEVPRKLVKERTLSLSEVDSEEVPQLLDLCQQNAALAAYHAQVAAQGRPLVKGEAEAMKNWAEPRHSA